MRRALLLALPAACLVAPAAAHAEDIYVNATTSWQSNTCPATDPCTLRAGLLAADKVGDVVHVAGGSYGLEEYVEVRNGVTVIGEGGVRPVISGGAVIARAGTAQAPTRIRHLEVRARVVLESNTEGSDLVVRGSKDQVVILHGGKLQQSLVVASGPSTAAVQSSSPGSQLTSSTVIATGAGARAVVARGYAPYDPPYCGTQHHASIDVRNVIARGTDGDLVATGEEGYSDCPAPATVQVSRSNFRTAVVSDEPASVTQGAGNQTTAGLTDDMAIFADATLYRQKAGAPTRDAGAGDALVAATDIDGQPRVQGDAVDIGADELPPPPRIGAHRATDAGHNGATLQAVVTPNAAETRVVFDYGVTDAYGSTTPPQVLPAGGEATNVQARVEGLAAGTTFHYRVRAYNPDEDVQPQTAAGPDATFATLAPPVVALPPAALPDVLAGLTAKKSLKLSTFRRRGLRVGFTLGRPGTAYAVKLTARLKKRTVTLARARGTAGPGVRTLELRPAKKTAARLRRFKRVKAKLAVTAATATLSRAVTIKR